MSCSWGVMELNSWDVWGDVSGGVCRRWVWLQSWMCSMMLFWVVMYVAVVRMSCVLFWPKMVVRIWVILRLS